MLIKPDMLENGGEIDFTANFTKEGRRGRGRVSLRKRNGKYEVYVKWFIEKREEVLFSSDSLHKCIDYTNALFGYNDEVVENGNSNS